MKKNIYTQVSKYKLMHHTKKSILALVLLFSLMLTVSLILRNTGDAVTIANTLNHCEVKCVSDLDCDDKNLSTIDTCYENNSCASFCESN